MFSFNNPVRIRLSTGMSSGSTLMVNQVASFLPLIVNTMKDPYQSKSSSQFLKTDGGKTKSNAIEVPSISLPKGGGAIKGIDEKFSVNAINGTSAFTIPLPFSAARGASPSLSLSYNSGSGNGIFGLGWNLNLASIKRKTDKGLPQYVDATDPYAGDSDTFIFSGAEDLVPEFEKVINGNVISFISNDQGAYKIYEKDSANADFLIRFYKPRIEGLFARIERWRHKRTGEIKWRVITRDNVTTLLGWSDNSRISDPTDSTKTFEWLPEFVFDDKGNCAQYRYKKEDDKNINVALLHNKNRLSGGNISYTNHYLEKVLYGNKTSYRKFGDSYPAEDAYMFTAIFDYGEYNQSAPFSKIKHWDFRTDAFSQYHPGFEIRTTRLCKRILFFHHFDEYDGLVKSANFDYTSADQEGFTFLKHFTIHGYIRKGNDYSSKNLPPTTFTYQEHEWNKTVKKISADDLSDAPVGFGSPYQFVDLYNEGLSGILTEQANGWYYKHNLGDGKFQQAKLVTPKPSFVGLNAGLQLVDLDANGSKQLVSLSDDPKGYFELSDENEWQPFQPLGDMPNIDIASSNTRMIDLNGDGKEEILISEDNVFTWYPSNGKNGFEQARTAPKSSDEEAGARVVFSDGEETIFLADMSGDGLTDIARIRNGEVCYWPNLGFGKFGAKVAMDNAPLFDAPDAFNASYIRLADIDGSGTTDIVYLGKNKFSVWLNSNGNSFHITPFEIDAFPEIHNRADITVTDLLANGVSCIVWSGSLPGDTPSPLRYVDLMNSKKPHIMVSYKNNLGKEVHFEYAPSTRFYIEDKLAGRPWVTKLHFPVHCVSKTETVDKISGYCFVTTYKYHHGHYDHQEREFRGFGMVEQIDSEHFDNWILGNYSNIVDNELHQEPIVSKTWSHTGAFQNHKKVLNHFTSEYWFDEMRRQNISFVNHEVVLPDVSLTLAQGLDNAILESLSPLEWKEAFRACKGMMLRSEVFSKDAAKYGNTPAAKKRELIPHSVRDQNYSLELLQPRGQNKHAVFMARESEAIAYTYERDSSDPRISHSLNIKSDEYGNILESAAVVYARMMADLSLPPETQADQAKTIIIYTQNQFTLNDIIEDDAYRLRLPAEAKTFELRGVTKSGTFYKLSDFDGILSDAKSDLALYHETSKALIPGKAQRRLIEHVRTLYRNANLIDSLPFRVMDSLAINYESYQLAYTKELLHDIFSTKKTDSELVDIMLQGKFIPSDSDQKWWIPSGKANFIDAANPAADTLSKAKARFYLPISYTDPFGASTFVKYYGSYCLFIAETEDAVGNRSSVEQFNFRTLSPQRMKDINDNLAENITDELGFVKAMAIMGKGDEADNLNLLTEEATEAEQKNINDFFAVANAEGVCDSATLQAKAKSLLKNASARFLYNIDGYRTSGKPAVTVSIVREYHAQENIDSPVQITFEYSNGIGQVIMKKQQAEPGEAKEVIVNSNNTVTVTLSDTGSTTPPLLRWIGNGRTILNNKGNPVKQYEPFFSVSPKFENEKELVEKGVSPTMYYDAVGRLIRTEMPDGTFSKVEFDAWQQSLFDSNDTAMDSAWYAQRKDLPVDDAQRKAADKTKAHYNTPVQLHFDTLGRAVLTIENNGKDANDMDILVKTKIELDIEGNLRKVIDARAIPENNGRGNVVMQYKYDMLGNLVYQNSMDAGERWTMINVLGQPLITWDAGGHVYNFKYDDPLHRATETIGTGVAGAQGQSLTIAKTIYGEGVADAKTRNLRGQLWQHYESSGLTTTERVDFSGNILRQSKQLTNQYNAVAIDWAVAPSTKLETEIFTKRTEYDALKRIVRLNNWRSPLTLESIYTPLYNERGLLLSEQLTIDGALTDAIRRITYNEKGQKLSQQSGCFATTQYTYDPKTFRLVKLLTSPPGGGTTYLQHLLYTYDPVGNISQIEDQAYEPVFFNNQMVEAKSTYTYDALYHLIEATGRENSNSNDAPRQYDTPWINALFPVSDSNTLRNYTQKYIYDQVGNILEMRHLAGNGAQTVRWTRNYEYEPDSNRLRSTYVGSNRATQINYIHDIQGNIKNLGPSTDELIWNYDNMIQAVNLEGGGIACYNYGGDKQRSRKRIVKGDIIDDRIYLEGFEIFRRWESGKLVENIETCHLFASGGRILIAENVRLTNSNILSAGLLFRYQYSNHLGSVGLELNSSAAIISYEEYHPYGTTAYQAKSQDVQAAFKRYRYTGMERDEETGLSYHGARYYLPWLARWCSADPIGIGDGVNIFRYVSNPMNRVDLTGNTETENPDNPDSFQTVKEKAVEAWKSGKDDDEKRNLFAAEINKKYTHEGMSGVHAWEMWATTRIPVDDILSATSFYSDDTAKLLSLIAPKKWGRTFDQLFVPGVPVDREALIKASGATAKVVEFYLQLPSGGKGPSFPSPPTAGASVLVASASRTTLEIPAGIMLMMAKPKEKKNENSSSSSSGPAPKQSRSHNKTFMDEMLEKILRDDNHPLRFLIDPATRNWLSRAKYSPFPTVQAGHLKSLWGLRLGERQILAIEDSTLNQLTSNVAESGQKAIVEKQAVSIGGIPIEYRTARLYEDAGLIPKLPNRTTRGWLAPGP
jgi:RHS repeat-associated protein